MEPLVTHRRRVWLYMFGCLVLAFLFLPSLIVIPMSFSNSRFLGFPPEEWSFRWYRYYLQSPEWLAATAISLKAAIITSVLATPMGTAAAYGLRTSKARIVSMLQAFLMLPLMVPIILIAIGLYYVYARFGLNNTLTGLALAHTLLSMPFVVVTVGAGLRNFDLTQEMVARSLGASPWKAFFTVTLPQIKLAVVSGALFAFITSLDEVVVALFISGGPNATIQRRMFNALRDEIDPTIAVISTCLIVLSAVIVFTAQLLGRRSQHKSIGVVPGL